MLKLIQYPKIRALIATVLVVVGTTLAIETFGWLVVHYGIEMLAISIVLAMAWLSRSIYSSYLDKYRRQREDHEQGIR